LEKKLLEIQSKQEEEYILSVKKEEELTEDVKQIELIELDHDIIEEIQEEDENFIAYEIEEETGEQYIDAYDQVEYLETEVASDEKFADNFAESTNEKFLCFHCKPPLELESNIGLKIHLYQNHQINESNFYH
jgi:hypothetical protein